MTLIGLETDQESQSIPNSRMWMAKLSLRKGCRQPAKYTARQRAIQPDIKLGRHTVS